MDNLVSQLKSTSPEVIIKLRKAAWKKFGEDHPVMQYLIKNCVLAVLRYSGQGFAQPLSCTIGDFW